MTASLTPTVLLALTAATALPAQAQTATDPDAGVTTLERVIVTGASDHPASPATSDTATLLGNRPGVSVWGAGGVSGLPALRGLADDRLKVTVDGADVTSACGNHMNPPLSYVDPTQVSAAQVLAGIAPVSLGGDQIGGIVAVSSPRPRFAAPDAGLLQSGELTWQARSVDVGRTLGLSAQRASDTFSVAYSGATTQAKSYRDGHGRLVLDTLFKATDQTLTFGARGDDRLVTFKLGFQTIPYQGYPNQSMDMTHNQGQSANLGYEQRFGWGRLEARVFGQDTRHEMNFFTDQKPGTMPMDTRGRDLGWAIKGELPMAGGTLRLGHEFHRFLLDDWWPPVAGSMMMGPDTYENIAGGSRTRAALFAEWEGPLGRAWEGTFGVRDEAVRTNAGPVQGYGCGMMCAADTAAATAFDARSRERHDDNVDFSALATRTLGDTAELELGLARKNRSPNLYERYAWGRGTMAMAMTGWFGDGNGYVGNPALRPEVATTASATLRWHDAERLRWSLSVSPYLTHVHDYIDADVIGSFSSGMSGGAPRNLLEFANHDARLWGVNTAWRARLTAEGTLEGKLDLTHGQRSDGGNLYHMMPANLALGWEQRHGSFTGSAQVVAVARKTAVDAQRLEDVTGGYALVNLGGAYTVTKALTLQFGVRNLFDRAYAPPLGGVDVAGFEANPAAGYQPVRGQGRSLDVGMKLEL